MHVMNGLKQALLCLFVLTTIPIKSQWAHSGCASLVLTLIPSLSSSCDYLFWYYAMPAHSQGTDEKDKTCKWRAAAECQSGAQNWLNCCLTQHWAVSSIRLGAKRIPTNSQSCLTISSTTSCAAALVTINDHEPHWVFLSMLFCCFLCSMSALDGVLHNYWMSNLYWSKVLELPLESRSHHVQLVFHFNPFSRSATWVKFSENQSPKIKAHTLMDTQPTIAALPFYCLYLGLAYSLYWPVFVSWAMFCNHIFN